jgi:predicted outer membrane repeat protein
MESLSRRFRNPFAYHPSARARLALEPLEDRTVPAPFTVTNLNDSGAGSLRQAILDANTAVGADTITFQPGLSGTITLTTGELLVSDSLTIHSLGAGIIAVSGNNSSRIFEVSNQTAIVSLGVSGLTLTQGNAGTDAGGAILVTGDESLGLSGMVIAGNTAGSGGGIDVDAGSLTLDDSTVTNNHAVNLGGGLLLNNDSVSFIRNSTFSGNQAGNTGGGINAQARISLTIENTTISDNHAEFGGGIEVFTGTAVVRNSTIAFNTTDGGFGGGVLLQSPMAAVTLQSTIVADNAATASGTKPDISGTVTATFSLVENTAGTTFTPDSSNNLTDVDPLLGPLQFNGGPTKTHALLPGSPAIHHGANPLNLSSDQRGFPFLRTFGGGTDIGAFEVQPKPGPTAQAIQVAAQTIRVLQPTGARLSAVAIGDVGGDFVSDVVLALRLKNGRLLVVSFDGIDGHIQRAFVPFWNELKVGARVQLFTVQFNANPAFEIALVINQGGQGVARLSVFDGTGARLL